MRHFLICYDITSPRRLNQVHRCLLKRATPLQYSVFLLTGSEENFEDCLAEAARLIHPKWDDLRGYPLPERGLQARLGVPTLPAGIQWSGMPAPW
jgi:CRISPR-associated protein Cas2